MKKLLLLAVLSVLVSQYVLHAQTSVITGTVTSSVEGEGALPGVAVSAKGTTVGTLTDAEGKYSLTVPQGVTTLVYSYIGMKKQEVDINGRSVIDVVLQSDITGLDEVVVTALGISREKKSLGYATQQIGGDAVSTVQTNNFVNSLSGKVSGVNIRQNNNMGGSTNVIIRGAKSLTGNNQALFVVDGVPIDNSNINNSGQLTGRQGYDYGNTAADINPNDIASIDVLKGAAASALYGSRAANGVVMITTKKGEKRAGKGLGIQFSTNATIGTVDKSTFPKYQQQYGGGYGQFYSGPQNGLPGSGLHPGLEEFADVNGDGKPDLTIPYYEDASMGEKFDPNLNVYHWDANIPESPNYLQAKPFVPSGNGPINFFKPSQSYTNTLDISGGNDNASFRFAYTNLDQTSIMPNSSLKRNNFNFSGTYNMLKNLKVTASANYVNTMGKGRNSTGYSDNILTSFRQWFQVDTDVKMLKYLYDKTGRNVSWNPKGFNADGVFDPTPNYWDNPYWIRYRNFETDERNRLIGFAQVDWAATDWLSFMARTAVDSYSELTEERKAAGSVSGEFGVGRPEVTSGYSRLTKTYFETNVDFMATFKKNLGDNFNLSAMLGTNIRRRRIDQVYASTNNGLSVPDVYALSNSVDPMLPPEETAPHLGVNGYFGSVSLGYRDMFYLDGTWRTDQSSTLPKNNWTYSYPSISGSFIFSQLLHANWLDLGKIRLNYAEVGSDAPFASVLDVYVPVAPFTGNALASVANTKNNPNLKPERTKSVEGGLELNMFKSRIGLDLALYKQNTINQILPVSVSYATGYSAKFVNAGELQNKGVELRLTLVPVRVGTFEWNMALNWARNRNEVVSLQEGIENLQIASLQGGVTINARVGEPYGAIQGTDYVFKDGKRVILPTGYYQISPTSDNVIGNINPKWTGGLQNTFKLGNLSVSGLLDMQRGGSIFSLDMWYGMATGLYEETVFTNDLGNPVRDPVKPIRDPVTNAITGYDPSSGGVVLPGVTADGAANTRRVPANDYRLFGYARNPNSAFVYDASFLKLREVVISYNIPKSLIQNTFIGGASLSFVGSNLWIIHKNLPHADPESSQSAGNIQGWQSGVMPSTRNYGVTLSIQF